jgi:DNA-binding response OmpR family regulator
VRAKTASGGSNADVYRSLPAELIVLLLSEQRSTAELISSGLADNGFAVRIAAPHDVADRDGWLEPDVIVLERLAPPDDTRWSVDPLEQFRPVVIVGPDNVDAMCDAFGHGAAGYVANPYRAREFASRLRAVVRRCGPAGEPFVEVAAGDVRVDLMNRVATAAGRKLDLTERQLRLLALLCSRAGMVVGRDELTRHGWDGPTDGRTVADHVRALRNIVEDASEHFRVVTMRGIGYRVVVT